MARLLTALTLLLLAAPAAASASSSQISIMQDDATFLAYDTSKSAESAMAEARYLGVDMVRTFVSWSKVSPGNQSRKRPAGFDPGDPNSPGYNWTEYDRFVRLARENGLKVFLTMSPPLPYWASEKPSFCPHRIGGDIVRKIFRPFSRARRTKRSYSVQLYPGELGSPGSKPAGLFLLWLPGETFDQLTKVRTMSTPR